MTTFFKCLGVGVFAVLIPVLLICSISIPSWRASIGGWLVKDQIEILTDSNEKVSVQLEQKMQEYDRLSNEKTTLEESLATANKDISEKQGNITELNIQVAVLSQQITDLDKHITKLFAEIRYLTTQLNHADTSFIDELTIRLENRGLRYFDYRVYSKNSENLLINVDNYGNPTAYIDNSMLNESLFFSLEISAYDIIDNTYVSFPVDTARFYIPNYFNYIFRANTPDSVWLELQQQIELAGNTGRILFISESYNHFAVDINFVYGDLPTYNVDTIRTQEYDFELATNSQNNDIWLHNILSGVTYSLNDEPFTLFNPIEYLNMNLPYFNGLFNTSDGIHEVTVSYLMNNEIYNFTFRYTTIRFY